MLLDHKIITIKHSAMVAKAAYVIASQTKWKIDPNKAHMAGMMHDIGKLYIETPENKYLHPIIGYELLLRNGNREMAEICISHPFPVFNYKQYIDDYCNNNQNASEQIASTLKTIKITPLIRLIQFADKVSGVDSYTTFEDKFKWYTTKYNIEPKSLEKNYIEFIKIKKELDTLTNCDVYKLLGL